MPYWRCRGFGAIIEHMAYHIEKITDVNIFK